MPDTELKFNCVEYTHVSTNFSGYQSDMGLQKKFSKKIIIVTNCQVFV